MLIISGTFLDDESGNRVDPAIVDAACETEVDIVELLEASRDLFEQSLSEEAQFSIRFFELLIKLGYEQASPTSLAAAYADRKLDALFAESDFFHSNGTFGDMLEDVVAAALENVDAFIFRYGTMEEEESVDQDRYHETLDKYVHAVMDRLVY